MREKGNEGNSAVVYNLIKGGKAAIMHDDAICRLFLPSTFSLDKRLINMKDLYKRYSKLT